MVVIWDKFVSTFVDGDDQSLVRNIGEDARAKENVKEFFVACIFYPFIEDRVVPPLKVASLHCGTFRYPVLRLQCSRPPQGGVRTLIMHLCPKVFI
jgi:hypothetical protein